MTNCITIKFKAKVLSVDERFDKIYQSGHGDKTVFNMKSKGFFAVLEGSYEALHIGESNPNIKTGSVATVAITFEIDGEDTKTDP